MNEYIPLAAGSLRWVFPEVADDGRLESGLRRTAARMETLAEVFGVRVGRAGGGLEFVRSADGPVLSDLPDANVLPGVFGVVDVDGIAFRLALGFDRRCAWDLRWGPPWQVRASIEADCGPGCGLHFLDETEVEHIDPVQAVEALERAAGWLTERATSRPVGSWLATFQPCGTNSTRTLPG